MKYAGIKCKRFVCQVLCGIALKPTAHVTAREVAAFQRRNFRFLTPFEPARDEQTYGAPAYWTQALAAELAEEAAGRSYRFYLQPKTGAAQIIGIAALSGVIRGAFQSCFLSYKLDESFLRRGYMTEAVLRLVDYAFETLGLHRIEANIMPRNVPSIRLAEACGFRREGVARQYLQINGVWEDHIHFVRLCPEPWDHSAATSKISQMKPK